MAGLHHIYPAVASTGDDYKGKLIIKLQNSILAKEQELIHLKAVQIVTSEKVFPKHQTPVLQYAVWNQLAHHIRVIEEHIRLLQENLEAMFGKLYTREVSLIATNTLEVN